MEINAQTLDALNTGFRREYEDAFGTVEAQWTQIATEVPSTTAKETYPWLGDIPGFREWIGPRVLQEFGAHDYTIRNRDWEQTVGVKRTAIEDDTFGLYAPMMRNMGDSAARHPDELIYGLVKTSFEVECYDGQPFFDTDHPVGRDVDGPVQTVSNMQAGDKDPWFLLDLRRPLKPWIFQVRKRPEFTPLTNLDDPNVFWLNQYVYGTYARNNVGLGFWQMAFASRAALTKENFRLGRERMRGVKNDVGAPLGIRPTHILVGASNEGAARDLFLAERDAAGASNTERNAVQIIISDYLD